MAPRNNQKEPKSHVSVAPCTPNYSNRNDKEDGTPWKKDAQAERTRRACAAANISPPVNFHAIRHTTTSLLVEKGVPLALVTEMLGHADTRMVSRHYSHLTKNVVHDEIRAKLPRFSVRVDGTKKGQA